MCDIDISRSLAARVGTHEGHVAVEDGDTVRDIVDRLAERHGPQVRSGILEGDRLRSDVVARRMTDGGAEPAAADTPVGPGDDLELKLTSEHDGVTSSA